MNKDEFMKSRGTIFLWEWKKLLIEVRWQKRERDSRLWSILFAWGFGSLSINLITNFPPPPAV